MRKGGAKTVVPRNIFRVVGEFGFFVGARHGVPLVRLKACLVREVKVLSRYTLSGL